MATNQARLDQPLDQPEDQPWWAASGQPAAQPAPQAAPDQASTQPDVQRRATPQSSDTGEGQRIDYTQPVKQVATPPQPSYQKVATAPDGVPVYTSGGNYYTQNADQSYTQQFQGGLPDWLKSATTPVGNDPGAYLMNLLNSGVDQNTAISMAQNAFNLPPGVDGSPLYYSGNGTIGLKNSYLAKDASGKWTSVARGNEGAGPGVFNPQYTQAVGDDPFSKLINDKLSELIKNNGHLSPGTEALNLENVRSAADRARKAEYSGVMSQLASRGLLPEGTPGGQGGLAIDALGRIENNDIAPLFSSAVRDYMVHGEDLANSNLMNVLNQATNRQGMLSGVALQTLAQNTQFNEFLATFGLQRDQVLAQLQQGQNTNLIALFMQYLQAVNTSAGGHY